VQQPAVAPVGAGVGLGGVLERERVGGQRRQRQLADQPPGQLGPAGPVPPGRQGRREGGHLGAAQGQPAAVEGRPQGQGDRLGAVPGADQDRPLPGQQSQRPGQGLGVPAGLDHQVGAPPPGPGAHRLGQLAGVDGPDPERASGGPAGRVGLGADHHRPGPGQDGGDQDADRAQPDDHDRLPHPGVGVQRDLEGGLDRRVQDGRPRVEVVDGHGVAGVGHEPVLVGVEGEHPLPLPEPAGRRHDPADGAVAVTERVGEGAAQGAQGLVKGQVRVDLAPVGEQLGPGRDPRPLGGHQQLAVGRLGDLDLAQLDPPGGHEVDRPGLHGSQVPPAHLRKPLAAANRPQTV
jgi:hypothetical protein